MWKWVKPVSQSVYSWYKGSLWRMIPPFPNQLNLKVNVVTPWFVWLEVMMQAQIPTFHLGWQWWGLIMRELFGKAEVCIGWEGIIWKDKIQRHKTFVTWGRSQVGRIRWRKTMGVDGKETSHSVIFFRIFTAKIPSILATFLPFL